MAIAYDPTCVPRSAPRPIVEAASGLEPLYKALQASASPLGHAAATDQVTVSAPSNYRFGARSCETGNTMALAPRSKKVLGWGVGIAAILVAAIGSLAAIPSGGGEEASSPIPYSATTSLGAWQGLDPGNVIPANIERTILIPADATITGRHNANPYGTEFDAWVWLRSALTPSEIRNFFVAALPDEGWHVESASASSTATTIIASKAGSDGSYWEVGIKDPTPGPGGARLQVRLLQVSFS